jgi:hypothetical protein
VEADHDRQHDREPDAATKQRVHVARLHGDAGHAEQCNDNDAEGALRVVGGDDGPVGHGGLPLAGFVRARAL